jgi:hypothetical protein
MIPPQLLNKLTGALDLFSLLLLALICLLIGVGLTVAVLAARAFWSATADQLDLILLGHRGSRRFLMGILNGPVLLIISLIMIKMGRPFGLLGLALLFTTLLLIFIGLIAEMALIGRRVMALRTLQCSLFAQTLAGGLTIMGIFLIPIAGQITVLIIFLKSLGTGLYWLFKRNRLPTRKAQTADTR